MKNIDSAAARAINALPADEAAQFDQLVKGDPYLRDHTDSFRRVATELVDGLPDIVPVAPPAIWERIVAEAGLEPRVPEAEPQIAPIRRRGRGFLYTIASVAAALIVGVAAGSYFTNSQPSLAELAAAAQDQAAVTIEMSDPADTSTIAASAVLDAEGNGYLAVDSLPALAEDRTYQLWVIVGDEIVSAALLGNDPDVVQFRAEGNIAGMAISEEVAGGVAVSENDPVALWLRDA
ncbi:MAG: anti-sigma factor [Acidimicrobiia bacterium]|nr:anti-sigma factor [Acidimicrobiia bacterium]